MWLEKLEKLISYLKGLDSLAIAFSGGVDSTFLLYIATKCIKGKLVAVTSTSPIHKKRELQDARLIAQNLKVDHILIDTKELSMPEFVTNDKSRCYYCKKNLFKNIRNIIEKKGVFYIADGANIDDMQDYRPGHRAAKEYGVLSPLVYAEFKKEEIRGIAKKIGLNVWNKPSSPCLATRIPYGHKVTQDKLEMVERAENLLKDMGYKEVRVRHYGDMARIEVPESEIEEIARMREKILKEFKNLGFLYVALDMEGFISGKLNRIIQGGKQVGRK